MNQTWRIMLIALVAALLLVPNQSECLGQAPPPSGTGNPSPPVQGPIAEGEVTSLTPAGNSWHQEGEDIDLSAVGIATSLSDQWVEVFISLHLHKVEVVGGQPRLILVGFTNRLPDNNLRVTEIITSKGDSATLGRAGTFEDATPGTYTVTSTINARVQGGSWTLVSPVVSNQFVVMPSNP